MEIYTEAAAPFRMGGKLSETIKTNIEEYERVSIGNSFYGILFKNKQRDLWHLALEGCGALIGSSKSKSELVKSVKNDVLTGDPEIMKVQIESAYIVIKSAKLIDKDEWFSKFKGA